MELVDVEEVFCKDCDFKDNCAQIYCDVKSMPRVTTINTQKGEWHDCYLLDPHHQNFSCGMCNEKFTFHVGEKRPSYCPFCGARME